MKKVIEVITELKKLGIQISLDDFGAGYTYFQHLKQIPFDYFKIYQAYVSNIPDSPGDNAITSGIISIGQSFNLKVVAEGIETKEQLEFLTSRQCDLVQGFYFYHPLPEDELILAILDKKEEQSETG